MGIRFRSRHLHATIVAHITSELTRLGWTGPDGATINFGADSAVIVDYQPEERGQLIATSTVAVSLGDYDRDDDEELGAAHVGTQGGGARSAAYPVFVDVYMGSQALAVAICDDIRDIFTDAAILLVDQTTGTDTDMVIEFDAIVGPERPGAAIGAEAFKKHWRVMRVDTRLFFHS